MLVIRAESPQDRALIEKLNRVVFAGHIEADLIEKLRAGGLVVSSLVAVADAGIVGHILFSDLDVRMDGRGWRRYPSRRWLSGPASNGGASVRNWYGPAS
jgi:putative acetyltransferase